MIRTDTAAMIFCFIIAGIIFILGFRLLELGHEGYGRIMFFMGLVSIVIGLFIKSSFKLK